MSDKEKDIEIIKKELVIKEAKELLFNLSNGISKTRDRSWQLLAFIIAVDVYLLKNVIEDNTNNLLSVITVIAIPFSVWIFYHLYYSILPNGIKLSGVEPKRIEPILNESINYILDSLIHSTQITIDHNKKILDTMAINFKKSLRAIILFIVICLFLIICGFIFPIVCFYCCG